MRLVSPVAKNTEDMQKTYIKASAGSMDGDEYAMFVDALPKQQRMLTQSGCLVLPFFRQKDCPLCSPVNQSSLNYFASAWAAVENILLAATAEGLGTCWVAAYDVAAMNRALEITPPWRVAALSPLGYAAAGPTDFFRMKTREQLFETVD